MVGIDDRGDDVAAEGGTNLVEQVLIVGLGLGIGVVADHELRAVGRQTAVQRRRHARREITAHGRRTEQGDLRLLLPDQAAQHRRMGQRAERREDLVVGHPDRVGAVFGQLLLDAGDAVPQHYGFELDAQLVGQLPALGQQFQAHVGDRAVFELDIDKYVVHNRISSDL